MKHCQICNAYFDVPLVQEGTDATVSPGYRYREELCPICGQPYIEDAAVCPICRGDMPAGDILCKSCRRSLLSRFRDFADSLREEEEDQLDEWLDGRSIKERSEFR